MSFLVILLVLLVSGVPVAFALATAGIIGIVISRSTTVAASTDTKCERCWHWRADVGHDPAHPTICGRCTTNLYGAGEARSVA